MKSTEWSINVVFTESTGNVRPLTYTLFFEGGPYDYTSELMRERLDDALGKIADIVATEVTDCNNYGGCGSCQN